MLKKTKVARVIANELMGVNAKKRHKRRIKKQKMLMERRKETEMMYRVYGKLRYYLALWFGNWILYSWNHRH
jgi:hypothetical protein